MFGVLQILLPYTPLSKPTSSPKTENVDIRITVGFVFRLTNISADMLFYKLEVPRTDNNEFYTFYFLVFNMLDYV